MPSIDPCIIQLRVQVAHQSFVKDDKLPADIISTNYVRESQPIYL